MNPTWYPRPKHRRAGVIIHRFPRNTLEAPGTKPIWQWRHELWTCTHPIGCECGYGRHLR